MNDPVIPDRSGVDAADSSPGGAAVASHTVATGPDIAPPTSDAGHDDASHDTAHPMATDTDPSHPGPPRTRRQSEPRDLRFSPAEAAAWARQVWRRHGPVGGGGTAGRVLLAAGVLPALVIGVFVLVGFVMLLLGVFDPWTVVPLTVVVAVPAVRLVWRRLGSMSASWWSVGATLAVAAAFSVFTVLTHSEHLIVERDAGSYAQFGYWLAHHGSLPITGQLDAFGGPDPRLSLETSAFFQQGSTVVPQFMAGWPLVLAGATWAGGLPLVLASTGIVGGLAILSLAGLAARLVGAVWAPLVALAAAVCFPILHISQATYSEPLALLLFFGGFCLLRDMVRAGGSRVLAFAAGGLLGAVAVVRIDAGREIALLVLVAGWLLVRRRREGWSLLVGLVLGTVLGVVDGAVLSRPYVMQNIGSVHLMAAMGAGCVLVVAVAVPLLRRVRSWAWLGRLAWPAAIGTGLVWLFFVVRPLLQEQHQYSPQAVVDNVARIQQELGLPMDGTRTYGEYSLHWVSWYLGWGVVVLAALGSMVLAHRICRGRELPWVPSFVVLLGSSALVLYRPGITPDHPWADRRLVPDVLPIVILCAVYGVSVLLQAYRGEIARRIAAEPENRWGAVAQAMEMPLVAALAVVMVVPAVIATHPLANVRTEQGELGAVRAVCGQLHPGDAVLFLNGFVQWGQAVRGECGVSTAQLVQVTNAEISDVVDRIVASGHTPVLAAGDSPVPLEAYGLEAKHVTRVYFRWDLQSLVARPATTNLGVHNFWLARPALVNGHATPGAGLPDDDWPGGAPPTGVQPVQPTATANPDLPGTGSQGGGQNDGS